MANPVGNSEGHYSDNHGTLTVTQYLKDPTLIGDAVRTLTPDLFITEQIFGGRVGAPGGAVKYLQNADKYVLEAADIEDNSADFAIDEGSRFHQVYQEEPSEQIAKTKKYGIEGWITFEDETRNNLPVMQRLIQRMTNTMAKYFDKNTLNKIATDGSIRSLNRTASWYTRTTDTILDDVMNATDMVEDEAAAGGVYNAKVLIMSKRTYGMIRRNTALQDLYGERPDNPVFTGTVQNLAGYNILTSRWMRDDQIFVTEPGALGTIADEVPLFTKPIERDEGRERIFVRVKRTSVAVITDPGALVRITNVNA